MATSIQITAGDASVVVSMQDGSSFLVDPNTEKTIELAEGESAKIAERSDEEPKELPEIKGSMAINLGDIEARMGTQEEGQDGFRPPAA